MRRDEHGIAVPGDMAPLPWNITGDLIIDDYGDYVCEFNDLDDADFLSHAANFHHRLADIVRLLVVWHESGELSSNVIDIAREASAVWAEMREDRVE